MSLNKSGLPIKAGLYVMFLCLLPQGLYLAGVSFEIPQGIPNLHLILEWSVFVTANLALMIAAIRFYIDRNLHIPLMATALACTSAFGMCHILTSGLSGMLFSPPSNHSLGWFMCRSMQASLPTIAVSLLLFSKKGQQANANRFLWIGVSIVFVLTLVEIFTCYFLFRRPLWSASLSTALPFQVLPLVLLLICGGWLYPKLYRLLPSPFTTALLLSVLPDLAANLYMWLGSEQLHDSHFNMAQALKFLAAIMPILGLVLSFREAILELDTRITRHRAIQAGLEAQIKQHTRVQSELEGQRNLLEITLSSIGEAIITTDTKGDIRYMNPIAEGLTDTKNAAALNQKLDLFVRLMAPDGERYLSAPFEELYAGNVIAKPRDALLARKGEEPIPIQYSGAAINGRDNLMVGTVIVMHDNSERDRVSKELAEARDHAVAAANSKSEFLTSVSHEMRTPMNAILGMVDLLMETSLSNDQRHYVNTFKRASENLLQLINDILDISVMESGAIHLETQPFDLKQVIEFRVGLFQDQVQKKGLALTYEIADDVPPLLVGDPDRLGQILFNLVSNALKFTHKGKIHIEVFKEDHKPGNLHFIIRDTGIGIDKKHQEQIFELFTQGDTSTTKRYGGVGLGLAICRNLIQQMRGRIWVDSQKDKGSCFHFIIQFQLSEPTGPELMEPQPAIPNDTRPLSILVVEDSADNQLLIDFYLKNTSYKITAAENGQEAVDLYAQHEGRFDLILMDIQMPIMDGYTATRRIREMENKNIWRSSIILALTASVLDESIYKSYEAGCNDHLKKPIKKNKLLAEIYKHTKDRELHASRDLDEDEDEELQLEMDKLKPGYLENRQTDMATMEQAIQDGDHETIRTIGHRMKGTGTSYGFPELTQMGAELEQAARNGEKDEIQRLFEAIRSYVRDQVERL